MKVKPGEQLNTITLFFTDSELELVINAYEYGKQEGESVEDYLRRAIITASELSKTIRGKTITCF